MKKLTIVVVTCFAAATLAGCAAGKGKGKGKGKNPPPAAVMTKG